MSQRFVSYIDKQGKEHDALVMAERGEYGEFVTLAYADSGEPVKLIDVPHSQSPERAENNPDLPHNPLNCWREIYHSDMETPNELKGQTTKPDTGGRVTEGPNAPCPDHPFIVHAVEVCQNLAEISIVVPRPGKSAEEACIRQRDSIRDRITEYLENKMGGDHGETATVPVPGTARNLDDIFRTGPLSDIERALFAALCRLTTQPPYFTPFDTFWQLVKEQMSMSEQGSFVTDNPGWPGASLVSGTTFTAKIAGAEENTQAAQSTEQPQGIHLEPAQTGLARKTDPGVEAGVITQVEVTE